MLDHMRGMHRIEMVLRERLLFECAPPHGDAAGAGGSHAIRVEFDAFDLPPQGLHAGQEDAAAAADIEDARWLFGRG